MVRKKETLHSSNQAPASTGAGSSSGTRRHHGAHGLVPRGAEALCRPCLLRCGGMRCLEGQEGEMAHLVTDITACQLCPCLPSPVLRPGGHWPFHPHSFCFREHLSFSENT